MPFRVRVPGLPLMNYFRCDACGRFISYAELDSGGASHTEITPDSAYTVETWETICAKCNQKEKDAAKHQETWKVGN